MKKTKENGVGMETEPLLSNLKEKHVEIESPSITLVLAVCVSCIGGAFQCGYNISVVNAPSKHVMNFINQTWIERYQSEISEELLTLLWSIIVSIFTIGGFVGAYFGGTMSIKYGRKGALMINNIFALLAAVFMGISDPTRLFELLIIGRFLTGVNAGIGTCVQCLYLGEIAPRALRGAMTMGTSVFITAGIFAGQLVGLNELLGGEEYWAILLSSTWVPAAIQLVLLPWFPESPRYLLIDKGDERACDQALKQLHGADKYHGEKADIEKERLDALGIKPKKPWELFLDQTLRWQLLTVIVLNVFQQLNGINAIYFYADYVFAQSGIPEDKIPYVTLGAGISELFTALTCGLLIESLGRKALIIGGYSLMALWCMCFTVALTFQDASPWVPYVSMICVFAFILSFGLGPGGVTNILTTELFTQTTRPAAYTIGLSVNWLSFFIIGMSFPFIVNGLQQYCFLVFLVICAIVAVYIHLVVPETKNKTFLEIHAAFQHKGMRKGKGADWPGTSLLSTSL